MTRNVALAIAFVGLSSLPSTGAHAQSAAAPAPAAPAASPPQGDESQLGGFVVTGTAVEKLPKIAILPSLSPDLEDVVVRSVVRRDLEISGLFEIISDKNAPPGLYSFDDPVDVEAWTKLGAEAIVKVAARAGKGGKVEVLGLAYFLDVGKDPVYQKKLVVDKTQVRVTAHRITDALLGALTGRPGGFASEFTLSGKWTKNRRVFRMDSDGNGLLPITDPADTAIAPTWGPNSSIFYSVSKNYSPFQLYQWVNGQHSPVPVPVRTSIYSSAFNKDFTKIAIAVGDYGKSAIYVGSPDGKNLQKVSNTDLATHPAWSPSGKLAWVGGSASHGTQRIYVDGKPASPQGFPAGAPTFCDTEDGIRLVYSVSVGNDRQDLIMSSETGQGVSRLTQGQGSNTYPACSPDGRLLAFFSTRNKSPGLYAMSLKRFTTIQVTTQTGESLRWAALPAPPDAAKP
jgi:TolB protein